MGTFIIAVILLMIVALIIRSMIRDKKSGKSLQCGVDCKHCGGHCHSNTLQIKFEDAEHGKSKSKDE